MISLIWSGLAETSTSCLLDVVCLVPRAFPVRLSQSLTQLSAIAGRSLWILALSTEEWNSLLVKKANKTIEYLSFICVCSHCITTSIQQRSHIFLVQHFYTKISVKVLLVTFPVQVSTAFKLWVSWGHPHILRQCFYILPLQLVPASISSIPPFCIGAPPSHTGLLIHLLVDVQWTQDSCLRSCYFIAGIIQCSSCS